MSADRLVLLTSRCGLPQRRPARHDMLSLFQDILDRLACQPLVLAPWLDPIDNCGHWLSLILIATGTKPSLSKPAWSIPFRRARPVKDW